MGDVKFDVTSTVVEKGIDLAKSFLDKLVLPAIEETGLLLKDQISMFRYNNQLKMIIKAEELCSKYNIKIKPISLKVLCPLVDYAGLEEDDVLLDKWAILLSNMVDSEQNIENHVFPYILSQLSSKEFLILEMVYYEKLNRAIETTKELDEFVKSKPAIEKDLAVQLGVLDEKIRVATEKAGYLVSSELYQLKKERRVIEGQMHGLTGTELRIKRKIIKPEVVPSDSLKEFEFSNVIRLGLVKEEKEFWTNGQTLEIPNERDEYASHTNIDLYVDVESNTDYILTELGELFMSACKEKKGVEKDN